MGCDAVHTRGPAIFGNAELSGQTLRYFGMCKEIEAKMRKQTEKIYAKAREVGSATVASPANNPSLTICTRLSTNVIDQMPMINCFEKVQSIIGQSKVKLLFHSFSDFLSTIICNLISVLGVLKPISTACIQFPGR